MTEEQARSIADSVIRELIWEHKNPEDDKVLMGGRESTVSSLIEDLRLLTPRGRVCVEANVRRRCNLLVSNGRLWGGGFATREELEALKWAKKGKQDALKGEYTHSPNHPYFPYYLEAYRQQTEKSVQPRVRRGTPRRNI